MKSRLAVRAFDDFSFAADRNGRHDEKQRDKPHSGFFGELCQRSALRTANHFVRFFRTPGDKFCADDEKHTFVKLPFLDISNLPTI